jgi:hypothetical protein
VIFAPQKPAKGRTPIPEKLPGQFFVLEYEREDQRYVLHVDDEDRSTFDLGDDIQIVRAQFVGRGYPTEQVNDLIDRAREFGSCQYIPSPGSHVDDRVIQILPREARTPVLRLFEDTDNARWTQNLR